MSRSVNPWCPKSEPLPSDIEIIDEEEILDTITLFLKNWPGRPTVLVDKKERHGRLLRTIAGYPKLRSQGDRDFETTPLDNPLTFEANKCFKFLLSLDSRPPLKFATNHAPTSLWTEILEYEYSESENGDFRNRTITVLAILFKGLGRDIDKSRASQSLLAEMFSYHNSGLGMWWKVKKRMKNPSYSSFPIAEGPVKSYHVSRIKNWIGEVVISREGGGGMEQAYLRGASVAIASQTSSYRGEMKSKNYSGVIIDGGGRLTFRYQDGIEERAERESIDYTNAIFGTSVSPEFAEILPHVKVSYDDEEPESRIEPELPSKGSVQRRITPWNDDCPRCNPSVKMDRRVNDWSDDICEFHRGLRDIGNNQRKRDSSLRQPSKNSLPTNPPPRERKVVAVSRIDGNSIGWALSRNRMPRISTLEMVKRRSMRFNAHWWLALSEALLEDSKSSPDRIACWVSAGDDIILGEYAPTEEERSNEWGNPSLILMDGLSSRLMLGINKELEPIPDAPLITFCAGISIRGGKGDSISEMLDRSSSLEATAKDIWKEDHASSSNDREMISREKLARDDFEIERMLIPEEDVSMEAIASGQGISINSPAIPELASRAEWVKIDDNVHLLIPAKGKSGISDVGYDVKVNEISEEVYNLTLKEE